MNYTSLGDSVNLANRLQRLNRAYGTSIIVSDATLVAAGPAVLTRPLDRVAVKGRHEGVLVHELIALTADATAEQRELSERAAAAFAIYQQRDFAGAAAAFAELLQRFPDDAPARLLRDRCRLALATRPPEGWDGIWRIHEQTGAWDTRE